ncbi:chloride channel protein [Erwinia pyrifoliae]|uniref:chloride channel protein n=1 Tax=Erwinia pyrifoliae TaxID=79967 RepID=UPI0001960D06|nr:chloride channel protein [Erwinia pyrifoliae]AUX73844.1 Cl- channel voltage-gated family protein [Erwinia pyrifoliae]MCA8875827.1 CBS domain-containing protein [Erwinia pyrifoliae]MCT2387623.1 chloride channel protein [Erwinia pyrifoliae]MCU8585879.1 chloride channel protein [Erwinia pyrifoliae]UWS28821.1 chloride channel protein [Erwinia pyrifoliae]
MSSRSRHALNWSSILVAIPVGLMASLVTLAFREAIALIDGLLFAGQTDITQAMRVYPWYCWPLMVGAGGLIAGFFLRYATAIEQKQTLRTDYLDVINARLDAVPTRTSLFRGLSSLASISSGASIGREGPMVQLSALSGSLMGRWVFKNLALKNSDVVAMAAAAGLSSVYHAPLASAIFVAEIAFGITAIQRLIPLIISSGVAVLTMWSLGHGSAIYPFSHGQFELTPGNIALTITIGLLAGLLGWGMIALISHSKRLFAPLRSLPLRLGFGGLLVGGLAVGSSQILGNGYEVIVRIMAGDFLLPMLLTLLLLKMLATAISVGSGAVGGLFTPALLIGALMGSVVALLAVKGGLPVSHVAVFAAIGMGALLASVSQAPLMAMLMVLEMTLNSSLLFPAMIASVLASMTVYRLHSSSTYAVVSRHFSRSDAKFDFDNGVISQFIVSGAALTPQDSVGKALAVSSLKRERFVYVIDDQGKFLGAVSIHDIAHKVLDKEIALTSPVSCVMDTHFPTIYAGQTIREGWEAFTQITLERLPVLNNAQEKKYLGALTKTSLIQQAQDFI